MPIIPIIKVIQMKDTFIFYVDAHKDARLMEEDPYSYQSVYPTYQVKGLTIARLSNNLASISQVTPRSKSKLALEQAIEEARKYKKVQFHIDPDAFHFSGQKMDYYFDSIGVTYHDSELIGDASHEDPDLYFELARRIKPDFVGIFEFRIMHKYPEPPYGLDPEEKNAFVDARNLKYAEGIERLIRLTMPDAENIIIPKQNEELVHYLKQMLGFRNFYPVEYMRIKGGDGKNRIEPYSKGEKLDIPALIKSKTFGIFDSHSRALNCFKYR